MTDKPGNKKAKVAAESIPYFVFGTTLEGDGSGNEFALGDPVPEGKTCWLHGDFLGKGCNEWLSGLGVPPSIISAVIRTDTRPRCINHAKGTLLIIRAINLNPGEAPEDMVSLRIWIQPQRMISIRHRLVFSVQDTRKELQAGEGPKNIAELLESVLDKISDRIGDYIDTLEEHLDKFEEEINTRRASESRSELSNLRRQIASVRRYMLPQREALENFHRHSKDLFDDHHQYLIQEQSDRLMRYLEDLELAREQALVLMEELSNRIAGEQNARMYVLSIVAAIFLPISFITGMFGMNVGGLPWLESPMGYIAVCSIMLVITGGSLVYFRYKNWL